MKITEKQYCYLKSLLRNYELKKDINEITPFEASIIIEGITNGGQVKDTYKNQKLNTEDYRKKQLFFNNLVSEKSKFASEKQIQYIKYLCENSKYEMINNKILRVDANSVINLLRDNVETSVALKYIKLKEVKKAEDLIKIKEMKEETLDLPKEWIMYDVKINGIIEF